MPAAPYFIITKVDTEIPLGTIGDPRLLGNHEGATEALIEFRSNTGISLSYTKEGDLTNADSTLPTTFQYAVKGTGVFNGESFASGNDYLDIPNSIAGNSGTIVFAPSNSPTPDEPPIPGSFEEQKGIKTRVSVQRHGLSDKAGNYSAKVVLNWTRF